jgi:hypothetical protein
MKSSRTERHYILRVLSGISMTLLAAAASGQTNRAPAQPPIGNRPTVVAPAARQDQPNLPQRPDRAPGRGQPVLSQDVKDLARDFQAAREAFRKQQQDLQRQFKTATEEQRALIREQLKENLQQWQEQQKAQIQDLREQVKELQKNAPGLDVLKEPQDGRGR